jgi:hypothetical protein
MVLHHNTPGTWPVKIRSNGKVTHRTIANISACSDDEIAAIKLALKHKGNLAALGSIDDVRTISGKRIGAVWCLFVVAERLGIATALGRQRQGRLALLQVLTRVMEQASRLKSVRVAISHALCEVLDIDSLNEDHLYDNLAWLCGHQEQIEKTLFKRRYPQGQVPGLFLYDVTSSYLEGNCNHFGAFGYDRDKKKGKKQIVVGLLTDPEGIPVAIRLFKGNTQDTATVSDQVRILAQNFGAKNVTLVGDRGMLKGPQIDALPDDFRYVTALTKPQIRTQLKKGVFQFDLFAEKVCEVEEDGVRYVLRRNPQRASEMKRSRQDKLTTLRNTARKRTEYLAQHPRAQVAAALRAVRSKAESLKIDQWAEITAKDRDIGVDVNDEELSDESLLDGCYVIKSDVPKKDADSQTLHDRYCDLQMVERLFRTMKTVHLELRAWYVRKRESSCGHAFTVMLGVLVQRELERCWKEIDITVEEGIEELGAIRMEEVRLSNAVAYNRVPELSGLPKQLLDAADVKLPAALPHREVNVYTKKRLVSEREGH